MVGGAMVADRCSAAWRSALSEFEEKTRSCLIQTGASFSSNLKHGPMVGGGRSLRRTDTIDLPPPRLKSFAFNFKCEGAAHDGQL